MNIVISQPMYLPWPGLFEQIAKADVFVHYDDVQLPQGRSFITRVQLKTKDQIDWLSVPIKKSTRKLIKDAEIDHSKNWVEQHCNKIMCAFAQAPFFKEVEFILTELTQKHFVKLSDLNIFFIELIAKYLGLNTKFFCATSLNLYTRSTQKLIDICEFYKATTYITGHGAKNYLDHNLFTKYGIEVEYMSYNILPYNQFGKVFTPYVTILDLIAYTGKTALNYMKSITIPWKQFINE